MSTDTKYNGWTNYETWNVALWLGNDEGSDRYWREVAQECYDDAGDTPSANARLTGVEPFNRKERASHALSRRLKDEVEELAPELGASMWADLLGAALSEVNWHEIAEHMVEDVEKETEEEVEEQPCE
jgi:hypothetical protein